MAYSYEQLSKMTVAQLREIAKDIQHDAVHGFSTMHKEKLLPALCTALGIDARAHHHAVGAEKTRLKQEIRELKKKRAAAIETKNYDELQAVRKKIHNLKRALRRSMV